MKNQVETNTKSDNKSNMETQMITFSKQEIIHWKIMYHLACKGLYTIENKMTTEQVSEQNLLTDQKKFQQYNQENIWDPVDKGYVVVASSHQSVYKKMYYEQYKTIKKIDIDMSDLEKDYITIMFQNVYQNKISSQTIYINDKTKQEDIFGILDYIFCDYYVMTLYQKHFPEHYQQRYGSQTSMTPNCSTETDLSITLNDIIFVNIKHENKTKTLEHEKQTKHIETDIEMFCEPVSNPNECQQCFKVVNNDEESWFNCIIKHGESQVCLDCFEADPFVQMTYNSSCW